MNSKKNKILIILAVLIIVRVVIVVIENNKATGVDTNLPVKKIEESKTASLDSNIARTPPGAMTEQNSNPNECQSMRAHYQNLNEIKKTEKNSVRFVNIHKKVDGQIYRTRFFYKDSSENEIPTYLLYREDQNDEPILIETSPYKKGPQYLKIEKALGEVIYTEEGVNIGSSQDLFLHYENNVLKDLQGTNPLHNEKDFIECRF
jgi:hypothetical protein